MRFILIVSVFIFSFSVQAQSLRSECQNAYYATGYVKLNQYINGKTIYKIKENGSAAISTYESLLEELKTIPVRVSCTYDI